MTSAANPPNQDFIPLDLSIATDKQLRAIQNRADRDGISFEEAALQMLLELADKEEQQRSKGAFARLIRFCRAH